MFPKSEESFSFTWQLFHAINTFFAVHNVFEKVADNYDLMNDLMSAGIHRLWKDHFVDKIGMVPQAKLLDVAGGTGKFVFRIMIPGSNCHQT